MKNVSIHMKNPALVPIVFFALFASLFFIIHLQSIETNNDLRQLWVQSYQFIALLGSIIGFILSYRFAGFKSLLGRSIFFFSLGLFSQFFGGTVFTYYTAIQGVELPYPSLADLGYASSTLSYLLGAYFLLKIVGARFSWRTISGKLQTVLIPAILIIGSYILFLKDYEFDWNYPLTIFLDFGYPLGDVIYIAFGIIAFVAARTYLGGVMKRPILLLLLALFVQFVSDYNFLYQAYYGSWIVGGYGDFIYMTSYCLMLGALLSLKKVLRDIRGIEA